MFSYTDVQKLADLALIEVREDEVETFAKEIDAILGYVSEVSRASGEEGVREKQTHRNVVREDVVTNAKGEFTEAIASQFPKRSGDVLEVPKIL